MNPKYFFPILFLVLMQSCTSCDLLGGSPKCVKEYQFELSLTLTPALDTFRIQDTIWIESTINPKIVDLNSGDSILIDTFDFKIYSAINRVLDTTGFLEGASSFDYLNETGHFVIFGSGGNLLSARLVYAKGGGEQKLRFGMVPKEVGTYDVGFYNLTSDLWDVDFPEDCMVDIVDLHYKMNDGVNNNFHLIKDLYNSIYPDSGFDESGFNHDGAYAFVVIE